jgi:hypothetical protein
MSEEFTFVARLLPDILTQLQEAIVNLENAKNEENQMKTHCRFLRDSSQNALTVEQENDIHNYIHIRVQNRINAEIRLNEIRNEFRSISRELLICSEIM